MNFVFFSLSGLTAACMVLLWAPALPAVAPRTHCAQELGEWTRVYEALKDGVEDYRQVKQEPVTPGIEQELTEKKSGISIAQTVQGVLRDRARRLDEARQKVEGAMMDEKDAFERCRRCLAQGRTKSDGVARSYPAMSERERFLSQLASEMLDEAFVQYKSHRAPAASAYSQYESELPPQGRYPFRTGPDSGRGYGGYSGYPPGRYDMPGSPYQGYFRWR